MGKKINYFHADKRGFFDDISIGVDIEKISRFDYLISRIGKYNLKRIFSDSELEYSISAGDAASHLAACFCAKEAAIKALSRFGMGGIGVERIEMIHDEAGMPELRVEGLPGNYRISASVSHSGGMAVASVLVVGPERQ